MTNLDFLFLIGHDMVQARICKVFGDSEGHDQAIEDLEDRIYYSAHNLGFYEAHVIDGNHDLPPPSFLANYPGLPDLDEVWEEGLCQGLHHQCILPCLFEWDYLTLNRRLSFQPYSSTEPAWRVPLTGTVYINFQPCWFRECLICDETESGHVVTASPGLTNPLSLSRSSFYR